MRLAFEGQENLLSATAPSSPLPPRRFIEPSHPQINEEYDPSVTGYDRLEELRYGSRLRNYHPEEEQLQENRRR
jgi:hypothetical protein